MEQAPAELRHARLAQLRRSVYDGDGSDGTAGPQPGSGQIEQIFANYFAGQGLASEPTAFDGRSDYGPFIAVGIPAGACSAGAECIKTPDVEAVDGGTGEPYDSCYPQACDSIEAPNNTLNDQEPAELGDAAVHAIWMLGRTSTGFSADRSRMAASQAVSLDQFDDRGGSPVKEPPPLERRPGRFRCGSGMDWVTRGRGWPARRAVPTTLRGDAGGPESRRGGGPPRAHTHPTRRSGSFPIER